MVQFASGNRYQGNWVEDRMEGFGSMLWVSMLKWRNKLDLTNVTSYKEAVEKARDAMLNVGSITTSSLGPYTPATLASPQINEQYSGAWKNNKPHGVGEYVTFFYNAKGQARDVPFQTHNRYVGGFVEGLREGYGTYYYADGTVFEGHWKANKKHGEGILFHADGSCENMRMENDNPKGGFPKGGRAGSDNRVVIADMLPDSVAQEIIGKKEDRTVSEVNDVLSMHSNALRYLYLSYARYHTGIDLSKDPEIVDIPLPALMSETSEKLEIPHTAHPLERNERITTYAVGEVVDAAMDACNAALHTVLSTIENYEEVKPIPTEGSGEQQEGEIVECAIPTEDELAEQLNAMGATAIGGSFDDTRQSTPAPQRPRRAATPMDVRRTPAPEIPQLAPRPQRRVVQSILTVEQFHALLFDCHLISVDFHLDQVDEIILPALERMEQKGHALQGRVEELGKDRDITTMKLQYPAFLEALVRLAHYKMTRTAPYATATISHKVGLPQQVRYTIETFFLPLAHVMKDVDRAGELRKLGLDPYHAEGHGNSTMEDLRRQAIRLLKDQQRQGRTTAQPRPLSGGGSFPDSPTMNSDPTPFAPTVCGESEHGRLTSADNISLAADLPSTIADIASSAVVVSRRRWYHRADKRKCECEIEIIEVETTRHAVGSGTTSRHQIVVQHVDGVAYFGGIIQQSKSDQMKLASRTWYHPAANSEGEFEPSPRHWTSFLPVAEVLEAHIDELRKLYERCSHPPCANPHASEPVCGAQLYVLLSELIRNKVLGLLKKKKKRKGGSRSCSRQTTAQTTPAATPGATPTAQSLLPHPRDSIETIPPELCGEFPDHAISMEELEEADFCYSVLKHTLFDLYNIEVGGRRLGCIATPGAADFALSMADRIGVDEQTLWALVKSSAELAEALRLQEMEENVRQKLRNAYANVNNTMIVGEAFWWTMARNWNLLFEEFLVVIVSLSRRIFCDSPTMTVCLERFLSEVVPVIDNQKPFVDHLNVSPSAQSSQQAVPPIRSEKAWPVLKKKPPPEDPKKKKGKR